MIQVLNRKYQQAIAYFFLLVFYVFSAQPAYAGGGGSKNEESILTVPLATQKHRQTKQPVAPPPILIPRAPKFIGGPSQPEMSSFKSVGTDNMVNLFTGDFSYNIPLLDVGGYPVNIYYDGGVGMEQEASWVGLGWNINPGSVSRNMRGIPDDFDGTDTMVENQYLKPNITWGGRLGADFEFTGNKNNPVEKAIQSSLTIGLGESVNNYLGPAIDLSVKGGINFNLGKLIQSEKGTGDDTVQTAKVHALSIGGSGSADLSSRDGVTFSASASLTGRAFQDEHRFDAGLSASTSFNSRVGIKDLQLSGQMTDNTYMAKNGKTQLRNTASENILGTTISFARPSYVPTIRMPMTNTAWSGHFQLGSGLFGGYFSLEGEVYNQTSQVTNIVQQKPMVGYMYYQNAVNNADVVMDFTRLQDKEVTAHTPIISAPQYSFDIFSIQGEGTGGTVRAYRTDLGYVRDNRTVSTDKSIDAGVDIGPPGHWGGNFNTIKTPTTIGKWNNGNNLDAVMNFQQGKDLHQLVYLRNPGESTIADPTAFSSTNNIGGTDLVRFVIGGDPSSPTVEPALQHLPAASGASPVITPITSAANPAAFAKRSQVITFLTADEATRAGLEKTIRNYLPGLNTSATNGFGVNNLWYAQIKRSGNYRKGHHISQINVTEADGKRYVYGIPVYDTTQTDFTFSVAGVTNPDADRIAINNQTYGAGDWMSPTASPLVDTKHIDGYYQSTQTPGYAHSFLLTGLLSPDYVDVTGDGITEDDLGDAVKFNYSLVASTDNITAVTHKWRTPLSSGVDANLNAGNRSETKDDKGIVSYGEREQWYLHSIESKSMIALFSVGPRSDGKGATDFHGVVNAGDNTVQLLDHIDLYNKADLKANGLFNPSTLTGAKPIKTVHFVYDYSLCPGTPDNPTAGSGKLTLKSIYFTFNGQQRANKNQYLFSYTNADGSGNPFYQVNGADRWGTYKPNPASVVSNPAILTNPASLPNKDYPYSLQNTAASTSTTALNSINNINANAGAWALKKILLPSGGQIEVTYESDSYGYVQNKPAAQMMQVVGFTSVQPTPNTNSAGASANLYEVTPQLLGSTSTDNLFVFVNVSEPCTSQNDVLQKYLAGFNNLSQLVFKYAVVMPSGISEYLTSYAALAQDNTGAFICGVTQNPQIIWLQLKPVDGYSPISLTALEYLRQQLPGQAFPGYDMSNFSGGNVSEIGTLIADMFSGLGSAFTDPINYFRQSGVARTIEQDPTTQNLKCFVRLTNPLGIKYGGGSRVKQIVLKDNWAVMTGSQYTSQYGQAYDYTTTQTLSDGTQRTISSGVASYEPSIGGEENPFTSIVQYQDRLPLGPASLGSVEMPLLDAFFPAPVVGYSKVTVRSLADYNALNSNQKIKSGVGRQVTQFYTAKDFPVSCDYTPFDASSDVQEHDAQTLAFLHKHSFDSRALSQGFIVATNDMHGKMKSQASYAANNDNLQVNYTQNFYSNTGTNGLNDKYSFVDGNNNGLVTAGNMGIDIELMTDAREFTVNSNSHELQVQVEYFPIFGPAIWLPFPWPVNGNSVSNYRAVTTTKVINYHSVVDSVLVIDKGSAVTTQNLLRDGNTGEVVVNKTNNEFNLPVYTTTYPAYWAYSGMGMAYQNIDAVYSGVNFSNGLINISNGANFGTQVPASAFESGDELLVLSASPPQAGTCDAAIASPVTSTVVNGVITKKGVDIVWAFDQNKATSPLTDASPSFIFLDSAGRPYTNTAVKFRIIRSGKRNLLGDHLQAVTNMQVNPVVSANGTALLSVTNTSNPVNASAMKYKEKWQTDPDEIGSFKTVADPNNSCGTIEVQDCNPSDPAYHLEKAINPYRKGLLGNFKPDSNIVYYASRAEHDISPSSTPPSLSTNLPKNGFLDNTFSLYWSFSNTAGSGMQPMQTHDVNPSSNWVFKSKTTRVNARGLELETIDALNINTAAQYGYNKTLPVAITNNSAYPEAAYEGFEDNSYDNSLNNSETTPCPNTKHIDFASMLLNGVGNIINATAPLSGPVFNAHTGKYVMAINPSQTATKTLAVGTSANTDFNLPFGSSTQQSLHVTGWNLSILQPLPPVNVTIGSVSLTDGTNIAPEFVMPSPPSGQSSYLMYYDWNTYINVQNPGTYTFQVGYSSDSPNPPLPFSNAVGITMTNIATGVVANNIAVGFSQSGGIQSYNTTFACPGIYKIDGYGSMRYYGNGNGQGLAGQTTLDYSFTGPFTFYQSTSTIGGCTSTTPIVGNSNMLQPSFAISSTKSMLFSAWVREDGLSANQTTYSNNQVQLAFTGGSSNNLTLTPSGAIIDGWQRYEGTFTAPAGATSMTMSFVNMSTTNNIYFDDIRIHPFNANMKSYVYDPISQRLVAQLDANNYASFYEYDEEGTLIRTKAETVQGIKTINETRSAKQSSIQTFH